MNEIAENVIKPSSTMLGQQGGGTNVVVNVNGREKFVVTPSNTSVPGSVESIDPALLGKVTKLFWFVGMIGAVAATLGVSVMDCDPKSNAKIVSDPTITCEAVTE